MNRMGSSNLIIVPKEFFTWKDEHTECLVQFTQKKLDLKEISLSDFMKGKLGTVLYSVHYTCTCTRTVSLVCYAAGCVFY